MRVILLLKFSILIQCTYSLAETAQLRAAIKEYEDLIRDYKEQVGQVEI